MGYIPFPKLSRDIGVSTESIRLGGLGKQEIYHHSRPNIADLLLGQSRPVEGAIQAENIDDAQE
jgi:hypothetical protein